MLPVLRPRRRLPLAPIRRLFSSPSSSGAGEGGSPVNAAAAAAARARAEAAARAEAYRQVQNFDWSSSADWKTAANILFTLPPKRKEFGLDFHLVQLFFVCMPSLAVYLVAQYARREIKRMEAEAEEKRKKEEVEKQKQLEEESVKEENADSKLSKVLVRLDKLEGVVKEIVDDKGKGSSSDLHNTEELIKKNETSLKNASDLKNRASDSQVTVKSKDISRTANTVSNTTQPSSKKDGEKAQTKS
ncbi:hypothetical protein PR202_ga08347 [Eleusine coracana subsp. coracana]|uniref:Uncharacterized protein n=1 Tax=Eleusine coracana subsp. coracana TaxID=191504 RepID=A0AAV5C1Z9_ELECO|nr:hypothetical protein QOZ80_1AG0046140 [Eleusine coracana subsp. coracana]GJM91925.1 hypothetical protein PR202_ga08347 [Eleusine coracana subsp. coracana]